MTEESAVMLYGYEEGHAGIIAAALRSILDRDIHFLSASDKCEIVKEIIMAGPSGKWVQQPERMLMFIGFDEEMMHDSMIGFPDHLGVARPMFCLLTQDNIDWEIGKLLEHLSEHSHIWEDGECDEGHDHDHDHDH